jgi:hypothetical protein
MRLTSLALTKHQSPLSMMCGTLLRCKHANSPSPLDVTNAAFRRSLGFFVSKKNPAAALGAPGRGGFEKGSSSFSYNLNCGIAFS